MCMYTFLLLLNRQVMSHSWDHMDCITHQALLSMESSREEYSSGFPFPSLGDLLHQNIKPLSLVSAALAGRFFTTVPPVKLHIDVSILLIRLFYTNVLKYLHIAPNTFFYIYKKFQRANWEKLSSRKILSKANTTLLIGMIRKQTKPMHILRQSVVTKYTKC